MSEAPLSVLAFSPYLPYPPDHGGRNRTFLLLRELVRRGHDVALVPLLQDEGERRHVKGLESAGIRVEPIVHPRRFGTLTVADRVRKLANFARGRSDVLARFWSEAAVRASRSLGDRFDVVLSEVLWTAPLALAVEGAARVLDTQNVEYVIADRTASQTDGTLKRAAARLEARGLRKDEAHLLRGFDSVICVSETDREAMMALVPDVPVDVVGNCVDTDSLQPLAPLDRGPPVCLFIGSANYPPNLVAAEQFATEVLPKVREKIPGARFVVVGADPPERLKRLASDSSGVEVLGYVDDILDAYRACTQAVVPITVGGGTRTKILEALALHRPVVSTTVGAEGLPVEDEKHLLIADSADAMAASVVRLHTDTSLRDRLLRGGRALVEASGSAGAAGEALERVLLAARLRRMET